MTLANNNIDEKFAISVVMPLYNSDIKYLKQAIDSLLSQSFGEYELIIVSEYGDESYIFIEENYTDDRIKIICNKKREGISKSLNIGISAASGKYIARMDADDICGEDRFKVQYDYMENNSNVGVCGIIPKVFGKYDWDWSCEYKYTSQEIKCHQLFFSQVLHPTVFIRKSILGKYDIGYNEELIASEDFDIFSRLSNVTDMINILDKDLFSYRIHESNDSSNRALEGKKIYKQVMKTNFSDFHIEFNEKELDILYPHDKLIDETDKDIFLNMKYLYKLLKRIVKVENNGYGVDKKVVRDVVLRRWNKEKDKVYHYYGGGDKTPIIIRLSIGKLWRL